MRANAIMLLILVGKIEKKESMRKTASGISEAGRKPPRLFQLSLHKSV